MITRTKKAFTLLELIVVLLVLGILAAIAVPTFNTVKTNSVKRTALSNAQAIARNANAISASEAGGVTTSDHVDTAAGESTATYDDVTDTVTASSGSITCTVAITISANQAVAGSASC
jgi:type IV pilus assembly protein PilA